MPITGHPVYIPGWTGNYHNITEMRITSSNFVDIDLIVPSTPNLGRGCSTTVPLDRRNCGEMMKQLLDQWFISFHALWACVVDRFKYTISRCLDVLDGQWQWLQAERQSRSGIHRCTRADTGQLTSSMSTDMRCLLIPIPADAQAHSHFNLQ